ncbi:MAG: YidC/Oxa1 family membrane protein insertase [Lachnospiraceae bacterium]|nr:YidC/Oxa1 family membrane protein insertase [Lachnospiraceae bacterium]
MSGILLTQDTTFILGPIAKILGYLMEGIFFVIDKMGLPNIGLAIILFTIIINIFMMPLTIKQQKFSKLNAKMAPELKAIQKKYANRKDNDSMMAMNKETQDVYVKYGVSPTGSCVQLLIQMPILFALYRVIYAIPAYVGQVKAAFFPLVDNLILQAGSGEFLKNLKTSAQFVKRFSNEAFVSGDTTYVQNTFIDCLNRASTSDWAELATKFPNLSNDISNTLEKLNRYNNFLGLNIANSPSYVIKESIKTGSYVLIIGAVLIPLLAAATQWLSVKLMPQAAVDPDDPNNAAAQSMKTMNTFMPLMSAFFCLSLPSGLGIYWIASAVVRSIQQVIVNKQLDKMDIDEEIKKNVEKQKKKKEKLGTSNMNTIASKSTKSLVSENTKKMSKEEKEAALEKASKYYEKNAKPGSIAAKANMVKKFNENNNK